jgi:hypothetical protein
MFLLRKILILSLGLFLIYCKTIEDKFEIKFGQSIQQNEFESDTQAKWEVDKPTIGENNTIDLEEIMKKEKINNNNRNVNREEQNLKGKPFSISNKESN